MGAKVGGSSQGGMDEINVTPLIDVVLVLLIIFMVMTPITMRNMAAQLPPTDQEETPPPPDTPPDQLMVAIYKDGTLALNLQSISEPDLMKQVTLRTKGKEKKTVFIDAHPDASYERVVLVMDAVRQAGAEKIGFVDMKDEGPAEPLAAGVAPIVAGSVPAPAAPVTP